jgi:hypothetical protein
MADRDGRNFMVGDTVELVVRVNAPGTRNPADPAQGVTLLSLVTGATQVLDEQALFDRVEAGSYLHTVQTEGFEPGVYTWLAAAKDSPERVAQVTDTFVLQARPVEPAPAP